MGQAKSTVLFGMLADVEATYGAGGTPDDAADGVQMVEETLATVNYSNDGVRGKDGATGRPLKRGNPSARWMEFAPPFLCRGGGAAYSATVFPEVMRIIRFCGWSSALVTTSESESYTFAMAALTATAEGGFGTAFARGQSYDYSHAYGSLNYVIDAAGYMTFTPNIMAVMGATVVTEALPAITLGTLIHPKAVAMTLNIGDFTTTPRWRRIEFQQNRVVEERLDGNSANGHAGFAFGESDARLIIDLEATAFQTTPFHKTAGLDPWEMWDNGTEVPISFQLGSVQYNKCAHSFATCQLAEPPEEPAEGPTGMWKLTFQVNDATSMVFD